MPDKDPIVLPSLAASRGPTAAVCPEGHVFSWFLDPSEEIGFCRKCGGAILTTCPQCNAILPGDGEMLKWVPYHAYCGSCGKPYPWTASDINRAKRAIAEAAEAEGWSSEVKARADEIVDEIVADRATASSVRAGVEWLEHRGAQNATQAIVDALSRLGNPDLKTALRAYFPGVF